MRDRKCPKCLSIKTKKYGKRNGKQRFCCKDCKHIFQISIDKIIVNKKIWNEYSEGNQSCKKLAETFKKSQNTIRRIIDDTKINFKKKVTY